METTRLQATEIAVRSPHISIDLTRAQVCIMNGSRRALSYPARRICWWRPPMNWRTLFRHGSKVPNVSEPAVPGSAEPSCS